MAQATDRHGAGGQDRGEQEARRILEHLAHQTEPGGATLLGRAAQGVRNHVAATDVDPGDRIEYWGTRIGRALGLLAVAALMVWLALLLLDRG